MVMGTKFVQNIGLERLKKFFFLTLLIIFFTYFSQVIASQNFSLPFERLRTDPLLDFPILQNETIEKAKEAAKTQEEPTSVNFTMVEIDNRSVFSIEVFFDEPVNKIVYIDASNGTVLAVKSTKTSVEDFLGNVKFLIYPLVIVLSLLICCYFLRKRKSVSEEDEERYNV